MTERAATLTEVLTCELHRQRELFLRRHTADASPGLERYEATVTFLHPGWAVTDWYGGRLNDCRVFDTQAEADAELDARVENDLADRVDCGRLPDGVAVLCDCGAYPRQMATGHHPDCAVYARR